jgi:hypothetical protein
MGDSSDRGDGTGRGWGGVEEGGGHLEEVGRSGEFVIKAPDCWEGEAGGLTILRELGGQDGGEDGRELKMVNWL